MRVREVQVLACDYDRTLTNEALEPIPRAMDTLAAARRSGLRVIIISGRDLPFLQREIGHAADLVVAENGCILHKPGGDASPTAPDRVDLRGVLTCLNLPIEYGEIIASADVEHEPLLRETLERAGYSMDLIRNRDRVMILPKGIDKAAGLLAALKVLAVPPENAAAAGDGENDIPLLREAGYGIAVANAVDELKAIADHVTAAPGGDGVADWIEERWLPAHKGVQA